MRALKIIRSSHFKLSWNELLKTLRLHVISGGDVWIKALQIRSIFAPYELSKCQGFRDILHWQRK
ncbi:hypothetical protein AT241_06055 [Bartonella henselae]|nr:hypothetical protein AT247_03785 [Bartonella henselae]OLL51287.1 hypothetical protein AT241_06055 [Bartonella henselae]